MNAQRTRQYSTIALSIVFQLSLINRVALQKAFGLTASAKQNKTPDCGAPRSQAKWFLLNARYTISPSVRHERPRPGSFPQDTAALRYLIRKVSPSLARLPCLPPN